MNRLLTAIAKPLSIAAMCFLLMTPTAHAQTPDASPPSREQACLKAGLTGKAASTNYFYKLHRTR